MEEEEEEKLQHSLLSVTNMQPLPLMASFQSIPHTGNRTHPVVEPMVCVERGLLRFVISHSRAQHHESIGGRRGRERGEGGGGGGGEKGGREGGEEREGREG